VSGPLTGLRIVELAGIGPGPFAAMMLSDMGAEVLRVDRAQAVGEPSPRWDVNARGRRSVGVDLKHPAGAEAVLRLLERADALVEGFRPGVTERLGLGPEACLARRPSLVYGRMTGWGQDGPPGARRRPRRELRRPLRDAGDDRPAGQPARPAAHARR
jgi:alpha-methylacyl-CoA racemase